MTSQSSPPTVTVATCPRPKPLTVSRVPPGQEVRGRMKTLKLQVGDSQAPHTCNAARGRRERRHNELLGEVEDEVGGEACVAQRREVNRHWVASCAGSAHSAHLRGSWYTSSISSVIGDRIRNKPFHMTYRGPNVPKRSHNSSSVAGSVSLPVTSSMTHLELPTMMEAFSELNPVPVIVISVPSPSDPGTIRNISPGGSFFSDW